VVRHRLWAAACRRDLPQLSALPFEVDASLLPRVSPDPAANESALFKRLWALARKPPASLIRAAPAASSTDDPRESVTNVLDPVARSRSRLCYWSSAGSDVSRDAREGLRV
jgi:hypothetical protein